MRQASPGATGLRRRAAAGASSEDQGVGCTTEDDTGVSDDPREHDAPPAKNNSTEGGDKLLARAWMRKMTIRAVFGFIMMGTFAGVIYLGHAYVCLLVFFLQCLVFYELVSIRKKLAAERRLPLFRFLQWAWFFVASFFTWSANVCEFLERSPTDISIRWSAISRFVIEKNMMISFWLYTGLLIISVLSLRKPMYKYQITQYTWTIVTICIVVFQTQAVFQIIYAGMFWFVLPSSLVICNDIMAYYCGQFAGRKFIKRPFLPELSPNKTWEGFLGSAIFTMLFAFWFSKKLSTIQWMTCVPQHLTFGVAPLQCEPAPIYQVRPVGVLVDEVAPAWAAHVLMTALEFVPGIVQVIDSIGLCTAQFHALCLGFFASFAAPFGGFLSSAIKRAYGIKDFNNLIPGHGGMMDRFDCQFVMFLCTFVHQRTFCRTTFTVDALLASALQLSAVDQEALLRKLSDRILTASA